MPDDTDREFFALANQMASQEAHDYLAKRMEALDLWVAHRESTGEPVDLRSLIMQVMREPNDRGPVIVALCTAMWELRELRKHVGNH